MRQTVDATQLSSSQHAYCKGKSTETALHTIVRHLEDSIDQYHPTLAAFIDIEGAFNNVNSKAIIDSLRKKNVDRGLCCWIQHMLTSRIVPEK